MWNTLCCFEKAVTKGKPECMNSLKYQNSDVISLLLFLSQSEIPTQAPPLSVQKAARFSADPHICSDLTTHTLRSAHSGKSLAHCQELIKHQMCQATTGGNNPTKLH
ncbi:hypothetical protein XENOCAPTIV_026196, partial [Xenoophorus captivus]